MLAGMIRLEFEKLHLPLRKLFLFGSRARQDYQSDSDWDFLAVCDKRLSFSEKRHIWSKLSLIFSDYSESVDLVIKGEEEFEADKNDTGKISYYSFKYGIPL